MLELARQLLHVDMADDIKWTDEGQAVGNLFAVVVTILVGVAAWWVSKQSARIAAASIVPLLQVRENILDSEVEYTLVNWGLGPVIIKEIRVEYPREPCLLTACAGMYKTCLLRQWQQEHGGQQPDEVALKRIAQDAQCKATEKLGESGLDLLAVEYESRYGHTFLFSNENAPENLTPGQDNGFTASAACCCRPSTPTFTPAGVMEKVRLCGPFTLLGTQYTVTYTKARSSQDSCGTLYREKKLVPTLFGSAALEHVTLTTAILLLGHGSTTQWGSIM